MLTRTEFPQQDTWVKEKEREWREGKGEREWRRAERGPRRMEKDQHHLPHRVGGL